MHRSAKLISIVSLLKMWSIVTLASNHAKIIDTDVDPQHLKMPYVATRQKRDGYGSYSGGGGGGYGGNYGCYCPHQSCDNNGDMLLYFSAGALLGLLFSMLQPQIPIGTTMGRKQQTDNSTASFWVTNISTLLNQDIGPIALDIANIYYKSQKEPQCAQRWLCELAQKSSKKGGLREYLTSLARAAVNWFATDTPPFRGNFLVNDKDWDILDCQLLGKQCQSFYG